MNRSKNEYEDSSANKLMVSGDSQDHDHCSSSSNRKGNGFGTELDGVASGEVELTDLNSSGSLEEAVFKIPHILELIMADLDQKTLINCRLVSPRWKSCALEKLQKLVNIQFVNSPKQPDTFVQEAYPERSMEYFITVVNGCNQFPATSFSFLEKKYPTPSWDNPSAIPFFNTHGPLITKLCLVDHTISFSDLWLLLSSQAPNLQHLELFDVYGFKSNDFEEENKRLNILFNECTNIEEQRNGLRSVLDETPYESKPIFKTLKVLKCIDEMHDVALLRVLDCAPNLVEVFVSPQNIHVLLKPTNRLHLVKEFVFEVKLSNIFRMKSLEQMVNHHENKLVLQKLCVRGDSGIYFPEIVNIMNSILSSCSATLKNLTWINISERFVAPQLPQVKCLTIGDLPNHIGFRLGLPTRVPIGVSLGQTYPNLKSLIILKTKAAEHMKNISIEDFFPDQIPLLTVTNITIYFTPSEVLFQGIRKMFPNAHVNVIVL